MRFSSTRRALIPLSIFVGVLFMPALLCAQITITLQNGFIQQYKGRATIDATYIVDKAHKQPNPEIKDADMHIAGRADEVKLPIVAEIMNAASVRAAVDDVHRVEGTGQQVPVSGAWRIWCEHGGSSEQVQGEPLEPFTTTNPAHVFEIHPITSFDGQDLLATLRPIGPKFKTKDAETAFNKYESIRCQITPGDDSTMLVTSMAGYNYVEFVMELSDSMDVGDGRFAFAKVRDLEGELLVQKRRMVMVKGSDVEKQTLGKPAGTRVHVLGIPRINLTLVDWRVNTAKQGRSEVLTWNLPYEIIVVGFYEFVKTEGDGETEAAEIARPHTRTFIPRTVSAEERAASHSGLVRVRTPRRATAASDEEVEEASNKRPRGQANHASSRPSELIEER
jgi:hypothetical protein